jgi:hypothetical protein
MNKPIENATNILSKSEYNNDNKKTKTKTKTKLKGKLKNNGRKRRVRVKRNSISIKDSSEDEQEFISKPIHTPTPIKQKMLQKDNDISKLQNFQKKQIIVNRLLDISKKKRQQEQEEEKKKEEKKSKIIFGSKILGVIIGGILSLFL